jgi:hypothetical protein
MWSLLNCLPKLDDPVIFSRLFAPPHGPFPLLVTPSGSLPKPLAVEDAPTLDLLLTAAFNQWIFFGAS